MKAGLRSDKLTSLFAHRFRSALTSMKIRPHRTRQTFRTSARTICRSSIVAFLGLMSCAAAEAQVDLFWDPDADPSNGLGGNGTWDYVPANLAWDDDGFGPNLPWTDLTGVDRANFFGTAGIVTLGAPITAHQLIFSAGGFVVENGGVPANTLTLAGAGAAIQVTNAADTATISARLGGSSLTKTGNGTLVLSGANLYSGTTAIHAGTLSISSPTNLGDGSITNTVSLNGGTLRGTANMDLGVNRAIQIGATGGTLAAQSGSTMTVSGGLIGSNPLTISGGGTVVLSGNNAAFDGDVNVNSIGAGATNTTLRLSNANALLGGTVDLAAGTVAGGQGTTLDLAGLAVSGVTLSMNSISGGNFRSTLLSSAGASVWNGAVIMNGDNLNQFNASGGSLTVNGNVDAGGGGFTGTLFIRGGNSGVINGVFNLPLGNVSKTDSGTWTINQPGTWLNTGVFVGTMRIGASNTLPVTTTLTMGQNDANNTTLDLNGFNQTVARLAFSSTGGTKLITNTSVTPSVFTVDGTVDSTYGGVIGGNLVLTKAGSSTLTISNTANSFTGNVVIDGGVLAFAGQGNANPTVFGTGTKTITLENNAVLRPTSNSDPNVAGGKGFVISATGGQFDVPTGVTFILNDGLGNGSAVDQLSGPGLLTKTGAGTLSLGLATGFPNRTGHTLIAAGTLQVSNNLGLGTGGLTMDPGTVLTVAGTGLNIANAMTLDGVTINNLTGANMLSGAITLASDLAVTTSTDLTITGAISGTGAMLTKTGNGKLTIAGAGHSGPTTINAGVVQFNSAASIGGAGAMVTVNAGGTAAAGFGANQTEFLNRLANISAGVAALAVDSSNPLDFAGFTTLRLGATGTATYSGNLTPAVPGNYRLGGGGGTLVFPAGYFTGAANLDLGANGTPPGVIALAANSFAGTITLGEGQLLRTDAGNSSLGDPANVVTFDGGGIQFGNGVFDLFAVRPYVIAGGAILHTNGFDYTPGVAVGNAGIGGLTKAGNGTLTLAQDVTYLGGTGINGGVLAIDQVSRLFTSSGLSMAGGTLRYTGPTATMPKTIVLGTNASAGTITVSDPTASLTLGGVVSGGVGGQTVLVFNGPGTILSTGANTFAGDVLITGGATVQINNDGSLGNLNGTTGKLVTIDGATLRIGATYDPTANSKKFVVGPAGATFDVSSGFTFTVNDGSGTNNGAAGAAQLQGAAGTVLTKTGAGTLALGVNTTPGFGTSFFGTLVVNQGVVQAANATALGDTIGGTIMGSGTTLRYNSNAAITYAAEPITLMAGATLESTNATAANTPTLTSIFNLVGNAILNVTGAANMILTGDITGGFGITKTGGTLASVRINPSYTGATNINGGTLELATANGALANTSAITAAGGVLLLNNDGGVDVAAASNLNRIPDTQSIALRAGGSLQLRGMNLTGGGTSTETVNRIILQGQGSLRSFVGGGTVITTLTATDVLRENHGVLYVQGTAAGTLASSDQIVLGAAPAVINGMVAPWMLDNSGAAPFFATYGANGFAPALATSTDLSTALATDIVDDADGAILAGPATVHALRLGAAPLSGGSLTISSGGLIASGVTITHSTPITFAGEGVLDTPTGASVLFTGLPTASTLIKSGPGTARFNNTAQTTNPGLANALLVVHNGLLEIGDTNLNTAPVGALPAGVKVQITGGALNFYHNQAIGGLSGPGGIVRIGAAISGDSARTLTINQNENATYGGTLDSDTNNGTDASFAKKGIGTWTLTGASRIGRTSAVDFGELILTGAGTLHAAGNAPPGDRQQISIGQGATLTLDNVAANLADRINTNRTTTNPPLAINGGTLNLLGNASAASNEALSLTTGTLAGNFGAGGSVVHIVAGPGQTASFTATFTMNRAAGGSVLIKGTNLGAARGAANATSFVLGGTTALTGGGGSSGTPLVGIYKGVIADSVIGGVDTYGLSTYDVGPDFIPGNADDIGVRRLTTSEHATSIVSGDSTLQNVLLTSVVTGIDAPTTVNALHLAGGADIQGTGTLTVNGGAILSANNGAPGANSIRLATLDFGSGEAVIHTATNLSIASTVTGAGGLTKAGAGVLTLGADNAGFGGGQGITINGGLLSVAADHALGSTANTLRLNTGGGIQATDTFSSARSVVLGNAGGVVDVAEAGETLTLSGVVSGTLGAINAATGLAGNTGSNPLITTVLTKTGPGTLILSHAANTFTGLTKVDGGTLAINGVLPAHSHVAVNAGGTLGGLGTIHGTVTANSGGILAPGITTGVLDVNAAITLGSGSIFSVELGGLTPGDGAGNYDQLNMTAATGNVSLASNVSLVLSLSSGFIPPDGSDYFILTRADAGVFGASAFLGLPEGTVVSFAGGYTGTITYLANWTGTQAGSAEAGGNDVAILNVVPEPGSAALLLAGLGAMLGMRRRRK